MRSLITLSLLVFSFNIQARTCATYDKLADFLNTKKFIKISKEQRVLKKEALLELGDINQARSIAYKFPAFKELGFGNPGGTGWTPYVGRLEKSSSYGKKVGWNIKNDNGHARVRLDWDKEKGAHYNIEITQKVNGKSETHKLAISFLCEGKPCSEKQYIKFTEKINN